MATANLMDILAVACRAREDEKEQYKAIFGISWIPERIAYECYSKEGSKFVFLDGKRPFCVGGWEPVIDGVYQSWMISELCYWETHWRTITKLCRKTMDMTFDSGARRLQTNASANRTLACRWYEKGLKMKREATLIQFCSNGEDLAMYSKLREQ